MLEEVSNLREINVESRNGSQTTVHHGRLGGNDPEGGKAAEVWMALVQEPEQVSVRGLSKSREKTPWETTNHG